ncbi:MAG: autotransporter-associated beta strand repeat-containing protein [Ferruginibacter sp.]
MKQILLPPARYYFTRSKKILLILFASAAMLFCDAQLYWNGSGTWNAASTWATASGGPYSQTWTAGSAAVFDVPAATITGATIACSGITASEDVTVTPGGTFGTGSTVITVNVATGKTFDFGSQGVSATAGTGFIKSGNGVFALGGSTYGGGFTLNAGTLVLRGVNAVGAGNVFTINGGTICSNASRNLSGKPSQVTINGNFTIGATTGLASSTAIITFDAPMLLGNAVTRTITLGNNAAHVFNGVISGAGSGITINATSAGKLVLGGACTYDGLTTVNAGTLQLAKTGGNTLPAANDVLLNSGGTLQISSNQSLHDLTLNTGSTVTIDAGVTLTIGGTLFHNGGNIVLGTGAAIIYSAGASLAYGASAVQLTSDKEFGAGSALTHLIINNAGGVILHSSREISGNLQFNAGNLTLGINDLTIATAGGFSAAQHVVTDNTGKLIIKNIGVTAAVFPVGANAGTINPVTISNGNNADYGARVETGFPFPLLAPNNAVNRTWMVTASATPGAGVNIIFSYGAGDANPGFSFSSAAEHGIYTSGWNINQSGLVQTGSYQVSTTVNSFVGGTPLPMVIGNLGAILSLPRYVDLQVQPSPAGNLLRWTLNTASPLKELVIERSPEGRSFSVIKSIPPVVSSYTDDQPYTGRTYYRIKATDINGKIFYSAAAMVTDERNGFEIVGLAPNIVQSDLQLNVTAAKKSSLCVQVTDLAGRVVMKQFYKLASGSNLLDMNVALLPAGQYYLTCISAAGDPVTRRFIKQ